MDYEKRVPATRDDGITTNPLQDHLPKVRRTQRRINPPAFNRLIRMLMKGDHTVEDLAEETGLSVHTVRAYCKSFVTRIEGIQLAHIFGWDRDAMGRDCNPRYRWGDGVNMPRRSRDAGKARKQARLEAATTNFRKNGRRITVED